MSCFFSECNDLLALLENNNRRDHWAFEFPNDLTKLMKWCHSLKVEIGDIQKVEGTPRNRICRLHFDNDDIVAISQHSPNNLLYVGLNLTENAIPMRVDIVGTQDFHQETATANESNLVSFTDDTLQLPEISLNVTQNKINLGDDIKQKSTKKKQTINEATSELLDLLASSDYKVANRRLAAGQYDTAVQHLKSAARLKHPSANFNLGVCYEKGLGVKRNNNLAYCHYKLAAALNHAKATHNIGVFYAKGYAAGGRTNRKVAEKLIRKAVDLRSKNS